MPVFEAPAIYVWSATISICTYFMEHLYLKEYLDFHTSASSVIPLSHANASYFIRRERADRERVVNVFHGATGEKLYTFERKSPLNPVWTMLTSPSRREIATIRAGFFSRAIDFHNKKGLEHRVITNESSFTSGRVRAFYLNDGSKYAWTRGAKFLEKIVNPNGGDEEIRERIAKVKLMRQWKFDFEMIIDETKVDREIALGTAFVSMLTQWGVGDITETRGPTFIEQADPPVLSEHLAPIKGMEKTDEDKLTIVISGIKDDNIIIE